MRHCLAGLGLIMLFANCQRDKPQPDEPRPVPVAPGTPASADGGVSGRVVETMSSGGYTYARLDRGDAQFWIAGPGIELAVGTQLGRMEGTLMSGFRSETLGRTFDQIYFVNAFASPGGAPAVAATPTGPARAGDDISGTVVETMNAAGYTYAQLDRGGTKIWIAGPETKLAIGTKLGRMEGTLMSGFRSDTLDRTFDQIYFVNAYGSSGATPQLPDPHGGTPGAAGKQPDTNDKIDLEIERAQGGKTVAEIFGAKTALTGKPVVVRGKIVKLNTGILGRNWIHLRDGTGGAGTNDLLVTTQATPTLGDVVVVRGTVAVDKDFGGGYRYDLVIEDATLAAR
jgi:hypothetical protein